MSRYVGLNRRSGTDRRTWDTSPNPDCRSVERRRRGSDAYVLVVGDSGIDRFGLTVGLPVACLIAAALIHGFAGG